MKLKCETQTSLLTAEGTLRCSNVISTVSYNTYSRWSSYHTQLWRWAHSDGIFPYFNNCNENTSGCAADLSIRVRYVIQYMYYISLRDLRDSSHSSSFDMMLICICSEKCYDVLNILYFRSESFIIQRHVDKLASKYVRGCCRTLRCPLRVFADHVSLCWEAFAVQVSPMSPSIHCITISYGLLSALGGSFVVCFVDGCWLLHRCPRDYTDCSGGGGIFLVMALVSSHGSHIAVFHPECIHSAEQCAWFGLLFS